MPSAAGAIITAAPSAANDEVPLDLGEALENMQTALEDLQMGEFTHCEYTLNKPPRWWLIQRVFARHGQTTGLPL